MKERSFNILLWLLALGFTAEAGQIKVSTGLAGCSVTINGIYRGRTDSSGIYLTEDLPPGTYRVEANCGIGPPQARTVVIDELLCSVDLSGPAGTPAPPASPPPAASMSSQPVTNMVFRGNMPGVEIILDGQPTGYHTGGDNQIALPMQQGRRRVGFRLPGYTSPDIYVTVRELSERIPFSMAPDEQADGASPILIALFTLMGLSMVSVIGVIAYLVRSHRNGTIFHNRYLIRDIIGRGGMATVYRARDKTGSRWVALKVMDPALAMDGDLLRKFLREGEVLQGLNRKYPQAPLVRVYDFGREVGRTRGRPFIAMELLHGKDLLSYLQRKGRLAPGEAGWIVMEVLKALEAAHAEGIYHRDLTPDNIIFTDGSGSDVRLIDFGVARHEYTSAGTLDGSITGKPPYMSPEQCRGQKVDSRSDIYSLGVVFFTLLTGHPPFTAPNPLEVMKMHEREPVPPLPAEVPEEVSLIVYRMLEKNPGDRFQDASEAFRAVESLQSAPAARAARV